MQSMLALVLVVESAACLCLLFFVNNSLEKIHVIEDLCENEFEHFNRVYNMSNYRPLPWSNPPASERERQSRIAWIEREFPLLRDETEDKDDTCANSQREQSEPASVDIMSRMMSVGSLSPSASVSHLQDVVVSDGVDAIADGSQDQLENQHDSKQFSDVTVRSEVAIAKASAQPERSTPDPRFIGTVDEASLTVPNMDNIEPTLLCFPVDDPHFEKEEDAIAFANERSFRSRAVIAKYKALGKPTPWQEHLRMPDYWKLQDSRINPDSPPPALLEWRERQRKKREKWGYLPPTPVKKKLNL